MGKINRVIIITLFISICAICFTKVYAVNPGDYKPVEASGYQGFFNKAGIVLGFVRNLGAIVSVIGIAILGIRYMLGSLEQKANYKETMLPFVIGIFITVSIVTIITIVQKVAGNI